MSIELIKAALKAAKNSNSIIRDWEHLETGHGTQRFHIWVASRKSPLMVAVKSATVAEGEDGVCCSFTMVRKDLHDWKEKRNQHVHTRAHGYLLVPLPPDEGAVEDTTTVPPVALVMFKDLMRLSRLQWRRCIYDSFSVVVGHDGNGGWQVIVPLSGKPPFPLTRPYGGVARLS